MNRLLLLIAAGSWLVTGGGCAASGGPHDALAARSSVVNPAMLDHVLRKSPVAEDQNLRAETLLTTGEFSMHLLQFRVGEQRHLHRTHDLTFFVQRGDGYVFIDDRRFTARPGDVFHIPRGTPHYCVNRGEHPLIAVLVFMPPFDLKDTVPLAPQEKSYEREPLENGE